MAMSSVVFDQNEEVRVDLSSLTRGYPSAFVFGSNGFCVCVDERTLGSAESFANAMLQAVAKVREHIALRDQASVA